MHRTTFIVGAAVAAAVVTFTHAGDLNPPAGAPAPTPGPEPRIAINATNTPGDADSVFKITQPGSYYLAGNITGVSGKHGVEIATRDGVAIDLMGFALRGVPGSLDGIRPDPSTAPETVSITNGIVRDWGGEGINLALGTGARISGVHAIANGTVGIRCVANAIVESCTVYSNGSEGLRIDGPAGVIRSCAAYLNGATGILCGSDGTISECVAEQNYSGGGISADDGCTITGCSASQNTGGGIAAAIGCTVSNCTATGNTGRGISVLFDCTVSNCSAYLNTGDGIGTSAACIITNCSAYGNAGSGISVAGGATVADCVARNNTLDNVLCTSGCVIRGNACSDNGIGGGSGSGIHATGSDNRIEGNNCTNNDRGIDVDSAGNFISRNVCSGNTTNWTVVVGNVCLVVSAATNGVAINGDSGGTAPGSTDPNANFTY